MALIMENYKALSTKELGPFIHAYKQPLSKDSRVSN